MTTGYFTWENQAYLITCMIYIILSLIPYEKNEDFTIYNVENKNIELKSPYKSLSWIILIR